MKRYVYEELFDSIRDWMTHGMTQHGHTLGQAISYTIVELGMMPREGDDPIWVPLNFTALFTVALENRIEGVPQREIDQWWSEYVRKYCANKDAVAAALETEQDQQAFLSDLARLRATLDIQ